MSSISIDVPTLRINQNDLQNLVQFVYKWEHLLKEFGAIKLQPDADCVFNVKKSRKHFYIPPTDKRLFKANANSFIYSIRKASPRRTMARQNSVVTDETAFWSLLSSLKENQRQLNTSTVSGRSFFYKKAYTKHFDMYRVPAESLLSIAKKDVSQSCVPYMKRAHGPGAVFPLRCSRQNLFTVDYHHEGGNHHWYVIPARERKELQQIVDKDDSSRCLAHGQMFIHPSLLDQHQIRYHRIVQRPNELVVLSAGTLAQSFTEDESWSESIDFALPSWIQDGHASMPSPPCNCVLPSECSSEPIDVNAFRTELIQRYIAMHLDNYVNPRPVVRSGVHNVNAVIVQTPNSLISDSDNAEHILPADPDVIIPLQPPELFNHSLSALVVTPTSSTCTSKDDDNRLYIDDAHVFYELLGEGSFPPASDTIISNLSIDNFVSNEPVLDQNQRPNELHINRTPFTSIFGDIAGDCDMDTNNIPFEEIMSLMPSVAEHTRAESSPISPSNAPVTSVYNPSPAKKSYALDQCIRERRTLFVTGLNSHISKLDIYKQFPGCQKVTIKRYHSISHLRYAFVVFRTPAKARQSLHRMIDLSLLGPKCHVEYATSRSHFSSDHQRVKNKKVAVTRIPEDVSEDDLCRLFGNAHILKYSPARRIEPSTEAKRTTRTSKVLPGFAFILFDTEQQAADTIKHANRYQINGQPLLISSYHC